MYDTAEEFAVGERFEFGSYEVTATEIETFASEFGPQGVHPALASGDADGEGPVAGTWHATAMTERMLVDGFLSNSGAQGSPGVEDLRWPATAGPGDRLACVLEVTDVEDWDEHRSLVTFDLETRDQDGEVVVAMTVLVLFPTA